MSEKELIHHYVMLNGYKVPVDAHGHYLDWEGLIGKEARTLTDPYGDLHYAIGGKDDFICMDFCELVDGRIILHAVLNSETGSFIQDFKYLVVYQGEAVAMADGIMQAALNWCDANKVWHAAKDWDQDPYYFVRKVAQEVEDPRIKQWKGARTIRSVKAYNWMSKL